MKTVELTERKNGYVLEGTIEDQGVYWGSQKDGCFSGILSPV